MGAHEDWTAALPRQVVYRGTWPPNVCDATFPLSDRSADVDSLKLKKAERSAQEANLSSCYVVYCRALPQRISTRWIGMSLHSLARRKTGGQERSRND